MKVEDIKVVTEYGVDTMEIVLTVGKDDAMITEVYNIKRLITDEKVIEATIKQHRKRRSLDANAYCWVLLDKIGKQLGVTKEIVYREIVRDMGVFEVTPMKNESVDRWVDAWQGKGLGWQAISMGDSKLDGYTNIANYFGSSVYDTKEMSILLEEIIFQAKELEINTITPKEQAELIEKWENKGF